jgi:serine/threonine-protein kinase
MTEFPIDHALSIVVGLCAGLAHVHERRGPAGEPLGIVHRDVSPQNVLVTFEGEIKLIDFGIATSVALGGDAATATGKPKGKIAYMSPEQARGEAVDGRSDVFSAGVILFELTTGHRLFKAAREQDALELLLDRPYPTPSQVFPGYSPELEVIVTRALAKDRSARWSGAREMQDALEELVRREGFDASPMALARFMTALFDG